MSGIKIFSTFGLVLVFLWSEAAFTEVYSFVDENGVVHYTNVPTDSRYRRVGPSGKIQRRVSRPAKKQRKTFIRPREVVEYDEYIREASARFNIPITLIRAVMAVESNFNPTAVSSAGAQGLMQLMPQTAEEMGVEDAFDPRQNILGGTRYLRTLANAFEGDLVLTLSAYNAGHQVVSQHMDIPPFLETQQYVRRVLQLYYYYKKQVKPSKAGASD